MADALRQTANAVARANSKCRVGLSFTGRLPHADAMVEGYKVTRDFISYNAMAWPEDDDAFAETLERLNADAQGTQPAQGMYANTMTAPAVALEPEVEQWLRVVLAIASLVFLVAMVSFVVMYKGPGKSRGVK